MEKQDKKIFIAAILSGTLIVFLALVYFFPSKAQNGTDHVIIIAINSTLSMIIGFLFGSSSGSQEKDKSINEQTNNLISALANSQPAQAPNKESQTPTKESQILTKESQILTKESLASQVIKEDEIKKI